MHRYIDLEGRETKLNEFWFTKAQQCLANRIDKFVYQNDQRYDPLVVKAEVSEYNVLTLRAVRALTEGVCLPCAWSLPGGARVPLRRVEEREVSTLWNNDIKRFILRDGLYEAHTRRPEKIELGLIVRYLGNAEVVPTLYF